MIALRREGGKVRGLLIRTDPADTTTATVTILAAPLQTITIPVGQSTAATAVTVRADGSTVIAGFTAARVVTVMMFE